MLLGLFILLCLDDVRAVRGTGLVDFHHIVSGVHRRLSDLTHRVVVLRRGETIRGWRN